MKRTLVLIISLISLNFFNAQVAIEKTSISTPSVSLEFGNANKGLVLPWVTSTADVEAKGVVPGSLVFDLSDRVVKVYRGIPSDNFFDPIKNDWFPFITWQTNNTPIDSSLQDNLTENDSARAIIGNPANDTNTNGILILSDTDKAMVLPKVASPQVNIINPAPGMIVFDTDTKFLMIFDGEGWTYWRPEVF